MVRIITCNTFYENGMRDGGYHEIYDIYLIINTKHLIATVNSIAENNAEYKDDDSVLESILLSSPGEVEDKRLKEVVEYFKENPTVCKVELGRIL